MGLKERGGEIVREWMEGVEIGQRDGVIAADYILKTLKLYQV